ncbi:Fc.00g063790.m01.CDS01 [Cosmosporella sp. VM-42]
MAPPRAGAPSSHPPTISISPPSSSSSCSGSPIPTPIDTADASRESSPAIRTPTSSDSSGAIRFSPRRGHLDHEGGLFLDEDDDTDDDEKDDPANMASWVGQPHIRGSSEPVRMVLLSFVTIGITFTWGIEMTYCTPYLLNLGLTKSNTSLIWIAGPLSGLIVQPIVGVIADESKSKWGRRRPLMVAGALVAAISLLVLGFTAEIVGLVVSEENARAPTIVLAVLAIYAVDFAINAVMSCSRSLIVDTLPIEKQQAGAAWASRMNAIGHIFGYGAGAIDLVGLLGTTLGDTQFKQLTIIASIAILGSTTLTCWAVTERVLVTSKPGKHKGRFKVFRQIYATLLHLPPRIQAICWAQFWSWIGWFPFLFYSTTWVGETYFRYDAPPDAKESGDALGDIGRIGSTSLVMYSGITFIGAWLLPFLVQSPEDSSYTRRPPQFIAGFLERFEKVKPDLLTTWICGHSLFAIAMFMAPFATSYRFATVLVCLCGLPWTIAMWAPTAFLGVEVNKLSGASETHAAYRRLSMEDIEMTERTSDDAPLHLEHGPDAPLPTTSTGELSGIYFGILNIYTTLPQFVGTFISAIVFAILEPGKSPELAGDKPEKYVQTDGPNAIAVCLFIGAMSAVVAAFATKKLRVL